MKKVIFIVCVLGLLWGCKKEKVEPVETLQFKSVNKKIKYSISQTEGSNMSTKSTFTWNESGRLIEMSTLVDSGGTGYKLYEKRYLEYNGMRVSKYIYNTYNLDGSLNFKRVNDYLYQEGRLITTSNHNKSINNGNDITDYTNKYVAKYSNDTLLYYTATNVSRSLTGDSSVTKTDTTFVEGLSKNVSSIEAKYYDNFVFVNGTLMRSGIKVVADKNSGLLNMRFLNNNDLSNGLTQSYEFSTLDDPLSDFVFFGTSTVFWGRLIDDWLSDLGMNKLYKRIVDIDGAITNYEHLINAEGLLVKTKMIRTGTSGNSETNTTTFFY